MNGEREAVLTALDVSHETAGRFDILVEELERWQRVKNLVGPQTLAQVWRRHILDSAQLFALAPNTRIWVDLGSGGGFPGLVIGALLAERDAGIIHLVEANGRKCAFLRAAARAMGISSHVQVHEGRIEDVIGRFDEADVVTARALAPLSALLGWGKDLLIKGAVGLFPKGQDVGVELTEASKSWNIEHHLVPSQSDETGRIVVVTRLHPAG